MMSSLKLSAIISLAIALIGGVPFALTVFYVQSRLSSDRMARLPESVDWLRNDHRFVTHQLEQVEQLLRLSASKLEVYDKLPSFERKEALRSVLEIAPTVNTCTLATPEGELVHVASRNKILPSERREHFNKIDFQSAAKSPALYIGEPYSSKSSGEINVPLCLPMVNNGVLEGFLTAEYSLQDVSELFQAYAFRFNADVLLLDQEGATVLASKSIDKGQDSYRNHPLFVQFRKQMATSAGEELVEAYPSPEDASRAWVLAAVPLSSYSLLVMERGAASVARPGRSYIAALAGGFAFILFGGVVFGVVLSGLVARQAGTNPLRHPAGTA